MKLLILLTAILGSIWLERMIRYRFRALPFFRDYFTTDLFYLIGALGLGAWMGNAYLAPVTAWVNEAVPLPRFIALELPLWASAPVALLLYDAAEYGVHRMLHGSDALWEIHKIHHSSRALDWLATFRSHVSEQVLRNLFGPALLFLLGFPLDAIALSTGLYAAFAVFNHSNTRINLRWIEPLMITPRLHRMHHFADASSQTNLGTVLTLWDRIFGTYDPRPLEADVLGVPDEVESYPQTWMRQFIEPPRRWFGRGSKAGADASAQDA